MYIHWILSFRVIVENPFLQFQSSLKVRSSNSQIPMTHESDIGRKYIERQLVEDTTCWRVPMGKSRLAQHAENEEMKSWAYLRKIKEAWMA